MSARLRARFAIGCVLVLWLLLCAAGLSRELAQPGLRNAALFVAIGVAPLVVLSVARLPVFLLTAYACLIPFNNLLGTNAGPTVTKLVAIVTGAGLICAMLITGRVVKPSRVAYVLLALTLYLGLTVSWAIDPSKALASYGLFLSYAALFFATAFYPMKPADMKLVAVGTIAGTLAACVYGDYLFWQGLAVSGSRLFIGSTAAHSVDPNEFAAVLLAPMALALVMFLRAPFGLRKTAWLGILVILFSGFALSGSRGAAIAFGVMLLFLLVKSRYRWQVFALIATAVAAMLASPIGQRFAQADVGNADFRFDIWKVGLISLREYWLTGAGIGNFSDAFARYYLATPHVWVSWERASHSILIGSAVEYGIPGFVLIVALWYLQFRQLANVKATPFIDDVCIALRAGVLGLFVMGFTLDLMTYKYTWLTFSLIALMRSTLLGMGVQVDSAPSRPRAAVRRRAPASVALSEASTDAA